MFDSHMDDKISNSPSRFYCIAPKLARAPAPTTIHLIMHERNTITMHASYQPHHASNSHHARKQLVGVPALPSVSHTAHPIPEDAPVTNATLPFHFTIPGFKGGASTSAAAATDPA
jgi:hypothetical protein